jgi:hypothetical protein
MAHPKLWDVFYQNFPLNNNNNNNLGSPKRVLAYPLSQSYIHPQNESKYILKCKDRKTQDQNFHSLKLKSIVQKQDGIVLKEYNRGRNSIFLLNLRWFEFPFVF